MTQYSDLICFSHLRWDFVFQRPQHLLTRAASHWRVWYMEEPIYGEQLALHIRLDRPNLYVVVPQVPFLTPADEMVDTQRILLDRLMAQEHINPVVLWYYTPMALLFSRHLKSNIIVYDCMDELSAFLGAPPALIQQEKELLKKADFVFTGGYSLFEAKKHLHKSVFPFPSCIDFNHFYNHKADSISVSSVIEDEIKSIGEGPKIGYSGVIDERLDLKLIEAIAKRRPDWQFIFIGPVVKIDPSSLPKRNNIHYLGMKKYADLPKYFTYLQVAMMPFALNESTRFISPTKTPEYLAAGLPVVSTPVRDVMRTYGCWEQVTIADSDVTFEKGIERALSLTKHVDQDSLYSFLKEQSWDNTWQRMHTLLTEQTVA